MLEIRDRKKSRVDWNMGLISMIDDPSAPFVLYCLHHVNADRVAYFNAILRTTTEKLSEVDQRDMRPAMQRCLDC